MIKFTSDKNTGVNLEVEGIGNEILSDLANAIIPTVSKIIIDGTNDYKLTENDTTDEKTVIEVTEDMCNALFKHCKDEIIDNVKSELFADKLDKLDNLITSLVDLLSDDKE